MMINTQQEASGAEMPVRKSQLVNTQVSQLTNKSVRSMVSNLSVQIKTGSASNMAARTSFHKVFSDTV